MLVFLAASGGLDSSPDAFSFTTNTGNTISTSVVSTPITPIGYNSPSPIAVTGTSAGYSINNGSFTSSAGTICPTQNVRVCFTTSASFSTTTCATLCIGQPATCGYFCATTRAVDTTPDTFSLCCYSNVSPSTYCTGCFTVTGIDCTYVCALSNTTAYVCTPSGGWGTGPLCVCNNQIIGYCVCTPAGFGAVATYCVCVGTCLACGTSTNLVITAPALPFAARIMKQLPSCSMYGYAIFDFCNNYNDYYFTDNCCITNQTYLCCCNTGLTCAQMGGIGTTAVIVSNPYFLPISNGACRRIMTFGGCCASMTCSNWIDLIHSNDCGCTWTKITNCCCPASRGTYSWGNGNEWKFTPVVTNCCWECGCGSACFYASIPQSRSFRYQTNVSTVGYYCSMNIIQSAKCCACCLSNAFNLDPYRIFVGPYGNDNTYYAKYRCVWSNVVSDQNFYYMAYATVEPSISLNAWCCCLTCITLFRSRAGTDSWEYSNWDIKFSTDGCSTDYYFGQLDGFYTPTILLRTMGTACKACTYLELGLSATTPCNKTSFGFSCICGTCVKSPYYDYYFGGLAGYFAAQSVAFSNVADLSLSCACLYAVPSPCSIGQDGGLTYASDPLGTSGTYDYVSQNGLSVYYNSKCNYFGGCQFSVRVSHKNGIMTMCGSATPCCTCAGCNGQTYTSYSGSYQCDCCMSSASCPYLFCCSCCVPPFGYGIVGSSYNQVLNPIMSYTSDGAGGYLNNHAIGVAGYVACALSTTIVPCMKYCQCDNAGNCSIMTTHMPWIWYTCANGANNSGALCVTSACNTNPNFSWLCKQCTGPAVNCGGLAWAGWSCPPSGVSVYCQNFFMICNRLI